MIGSSRKNYQHDGVIDYFDEKGRKIAESKRNDLFRHGERIFRKK